MIGPDLAGRAEAVANKAVVRLFGSIESSDEYVALLLQAVEETATDVGEDLRSDQGADARRREALGLVAYKLEQLRFHLTTSRRRLGDLRALRRILDGETEMEHGQQAGA